MTPSRMFLYSRTVCNLKFVQIVNRFFRLFRSTVVAQNPPPPLRELAPAEGKTIGRPRTMLSPLEFRFLNVTRRIGNVAAWNDPAFPRLWLYNLHYFDGLMAPPSAEHIALQRALIARWIAENPPAGGAG